MEKDPTTRVRNVIRWLAALGEQHRSKWLEVEPDKVRTDPFYGLKCFLLYANQRSGCPRGYAVAGIKAVAQCEKAGRPLSALPSFFNRLYYGKKNQRVMPVLDSRIGNLSIPRVVAQVEAGELSAAFDAIDLSGVGHKIKSLFLRDLALATKAERRHWTLQEHYIYCQPVDVWVRITMGCLRKISSRKVLPTMRKRIGLNRKDKEHVALLTELALDAGVSPLHVNHGIWYFARHAVEDEGRLRHLLRTGDEDDLRVELDEIGAFANQF